MLHSLRFFLSLTLLSAAVGGVIHADVPIEAVGKSEALPPFKHTWFWSNDAMLHRVTLTDYETNRMLGSVDGSWLITTPLTLHHSNREFFVPATYYSRGSRGERTDVITFYDSHSLTPNGEVILPPKRAMNSLPMANALVTDDDKFLVVFNMVPAQSISVVDIAQRKFVTEIATPGCGLVYGAGAHRVMMFCGNGDLMLVTLNDNGMEKSIERVAAQFDPQQDPVREVGQRIGDTWYFVSFNGFVYSIDVSQPKPVFEKPWSLFSDKERKANWRIGGRQYLAVHGASHRLFVLLHQGEPGTHKLGGTHVWVYDTQTHRQLDKVKLKSPGFTFTSEPLTFNDNWTWLYNFLTDFSFAEPHARPDLIAVTQDEHPAFLLSGESTGMVAVYDALTMKFRHRVATANIINMTLQPSTWADESGDTK